MDRDRLKDVQQTDLTESRVNEEFVTWLKKSGPTWLLAVLVVAVAYLGINRYRDYQETKVNEGWTALLNTDHPESLVEVADEHGDIAAIGPMARLKAADLYLRSVAARRSINEEPTATEYEEIDDAEAAGYLDEADRLYQMVIDADNDSRGMTLQVASALAGKAAVAESRGNPEQASDLYSRAAKRVETYYPDLASHLATRAGDVERFKTDVKLMPRADLARAVGPGPRRSRVDVPTGLMNIVLPENVPATTAPPPAFGIPSLSAPGG